MEPQPELKSKPSIDLSDTTDNLFDFESFFVSIKESVSSDSGDIELGSYLLAYEQLYNFFILLGGAFSFVASDVKNKIKILKEFQENEKQKSSKTYNFATVKKMVNYEKEMDFFSNSKYVSGSRTLLRLHRGLDFIRKFLKEIYDAEDSTKLGGVARQIYDKTLAEYHTWVVKNAARVAMQFLPTRIDLLNKISENNKEKLTYMLEIFPEAVNTVNIAYDRVQEIYSDNNILHLP